MEFLIGYVLSFQVTAPVLFSMFADANIVEELFKRSCVLFTQGEAKQVPTQEHLSRQNPMFFRGSSEHEWSGQMHFTVCGMIENTKVYMVVYCAPPYMHCQKKAGLCSAPTPFFQALVTNVLQRHWEGQENRMKTLMHLVHLVQDDVRAQSARQDRLQRGQARHYCQIIEGDGVRGWIIAAMLKEDLKRLTSCESWETEFRHSR